jgi:hypothetical protein
MIVHMLVLVLMDLVIVTQDLMDLIVQLKFVQMDVQDMVFAQLIILLVIVLQDGLVLIVH